MQVDQKRATYRMLILIATKKLAEKAAELFLSKGVPVQYRLNAKGTASSEIMDTLGLGSVDKYLLIATLPTDISNKMLRLLHSELRLDAVNSGIAFTVPLTGASKLMINMMNDESVINSAEIQGKGESIMNDTVYTLISAVVDRGFSGEVMEAARAAGAGGGTVVHSRGIESEKATGFWGLGVQEEKEIVLILADTENKLKIMSAISEKCGIKSDAKGLVMSLPIDSVMGI